MRRIIMLTMVLISAVAFANGTNEATATGGKKVIELTMFYMNEQERFELLEQAAVALNEHLAADNVEIKLINDHYAGSNRAEWRNNLSMRVVSGNAPELMAHSHANIPFFVEADYVKQVDDIINSPAYADAVQVLKETAMYKGHYYAIPMDIEARNIWYSKDNLRKIGLTDSDFDRMFEESLTGDFTMDDFLSLCQRVKNAGVSDYVFTHRPVTGPENPMTAMHFGCVFMDEKTGKLQLHKAAMEKNLQFYYDNVYTYGFTPAEMMDMSWDEISNVWATHKTTFWLGGVWNRHTLVRFTDYDETTSMDHWGIFMLPALEKGGKPLSVSNPYYYYISSKISDEKYKYAKMLFEEAAKPQYAVPYAIKSSHLAFNTRSAQDPAYKKDAHLSRSYHMLEFSVTEPHHEKFPIFSDVLTEAMSAVEHKKMSPAQAVDYMEKSLLSQMPDDIIILK
ncbi:MAG: extracellular solute-binding protein [Candidatus Latescibacteria bacterium]|nr:extracellular solute-binding protein [Candidatus Latescibacterota bacterium]